MEYEIISAFEQIIGSRAIEFEESTLRLYAQSANGSSIMPICILYPSKAGEVVEIVKMANKLNVPLHPISRGMNWGYGSAQGSAANQVVLDLSKMNKIIEVDAVLGTMTLEPGVSQWQAYQYFDENSLDDFQLDVTGAGKNASIVGNMLERGFGHTDYGDRYQRLICMKVVLGNGTIIQTAFGGLSNASASKTYGYGIGPHLNGLFTQSNFGIVVEMTIELMPKPEMFCMFLVTVEHKSDFVNLIKAIRELRLKGVVNSTVHIANKSRTVGEKENRFAGFWNGGGSISGPSEMVKSKRKVVRKVLKSHLGSHKCRFITDHTLRFLHRVDRIKKLPFLNDLSYICDLQKGIPTDEPLKILFDESEVNFNHLSTDNFPSYFRWIPAVSCADEKSALRLLEILEENFNKYNYQFRITVTFINPRTLTFISNISYNKDVESVKKAKQFYDHLMALLAKNGYFPYRSGSGMFQIDEYRDTATTNLLKGIKKFVDPNLIIAPNKYGI